MKHIPFYYKFKKPEIPSSSSQRLRILKGIRRALSCNLKEASELLSKLEEGTEEIFTNPWLAQELQDFYSLVDVSGLSPEAAEIYAFQAVDPLLEKAEEWYKGLEKWQQNYVDTLVRHRGYSPPMG